MSNKSGDKTQIKNILNIHIATLGETEVGKSCLIFRYIDKTFSETYLSTIGIDTKFKKLKVENGEEIKVKISDTAGQERFKFLASNYMRKADGIILVYDITKKSSFEGVKNWANTLKEEFGNSKPYILLGNKYDKEDKREVSEEEGKDFAFNKGIKFYETSCKTGFNVEEAINDLVNQVYEKLSKKKKKEINENKESVQISGNKNSEKEKKKFC